MTSMFDYDDTVNLAFDAKIAGKKLVAAKHELLTKTGEFLFLAHTDKELAQRMQMVETDIEKVAHRKLANVSDSKAKLVRAIYDEWSIRHANCDFCNGTDNLKEASNKAASGVPTKATADNHDVQPTSSQPSSAPSLVEQAVKSRQNGEHQTALNDAPSNDTQSGFSSASDVAAHQKANDAAPAPAVTNPFTQFPTETTTKPSTSDKASGFSSAADVAAHDKENKPTAPVATPKPQMGQAMIDAGMKSDPDKSTAKPAPSSASSAIDTANKNLSTQHGVASTSGGSGSTESSGSSGGSENKNTAPVINGKLTPNQINQNFDSSGNNQYTFAPTQGGNIPGTSAPTKLPVTPSPSPTPATGNTAMGGSTAMGGNGTPAPSTPTPTTVAPVTPPATTTPAPPVANEAAGFDPGALLGTTASKINSAIAKIKSVKDINFTKEGIAVAPMGGGSTPAPVAPSVPAPAAPKPAPVSTSTGGPGGSGGASALGASPVAPIITAPAGTSTNSGIAQAAPTPAPAPVAPATPAAPAAAPTPVSMPAPAAPMATPAVPVNEAAGFNPGAMMGTNS